MKRKPRLDEILVERGLFDDVHAAQAAVLAGEVVVGEHRETSAGKRLDPDVPIRLKAGKEKDRLGFASRGGGKLAGALAVFDFEVSGLDCVDLGCSSGGFTDCLLQNGAAHVSAVDIGYAQFEWRLRNDARVDLFERTNVEGIDVEAVGGPFDLAVADLSFIRLERVLPDVRRLLKPAGCAIMLVKPQFEVPKERVGKGGVVSDASDQERAIESVVAAMRETGLADRGLACSPVPGPKGNREFFVLAERPDNDSGVGRGSIGADSIRDVVRAAHGA